MSDDATRTAAPRTRRVADPEVQAMAEADRILCELGDEHKAGRVLLWLVSKHCPQMLGFAQRVATDPKGPPVALLDNYSGQER